MLLVAFGSTASYAAGGLMIAKKDHLTGDDLSEEFKTCKLGKSQSPLNIDTKLVKKSNVRQVKISTKHLMLS